MKKVSGVVIALFLLSMALISVPVSAHTEADPLVVDLLAGQTIDVGDVLVWNDGDYLYVKYVTTDGWLLTETHLAIATELSGIPQTKTGNPIPGKFTYFAYHDPPVDEYTYPIDLTWDPGTILYIAAHAVVRHDYTLLLVSDAGNTWFDGNPAVDAYEPNTWYPNPPYTESSPSLWDNVISSSHNFELSGADWIWNTYFVNDDDSTHGWSGEIVEFTRTFDIPGTPTAGTLWITCDNGYEAKLNGQHIGSAQLSGEWRTSDLHEAYVHTYGWQTAESYNVLGALGTGQNTLAITGVNEYLNTDDGDPFLGDEGKNPAGLIYELNINYYKQETAWGAGVGFPGRNWATYFIYKDQRIVVTEGQWTATLGAGVRYRSFANTGGQEIYMGPNMGAGGYPNRVTQEFWWSKPGTHEISFTYDPVANTLTTVVDGNPPLVYSDISLHAGCLPSTWNVMQIIVVIRDVNTIVDLNNVLLDGNPLGDFPGIYGLGTAGWRYWTVSNYDFSQGFTLTGQIYLGGPFSGSQESCKVEVDVGHAP